MAGRSLHPHLKRIPNEEGRKHRLHGLKLLGALEARLRATGQRFGTWRRTLSDGTQIMVGFIASSIGPPIRMLRIKTPSGATFEVLEFYMDSGYLDLGNYVLTLPEPLTELDFIVDPSTLYQSTTTEDLQSTYGGNRLDGLKLYPVVAEIVDAAYPPSFNYSDQESKELLWDKTRNNLNGTEYWAGNATGMLRLMLQGKNGLIVGDTRYFQIQNSINATTTSNILYFDEDLIEWWVVNINPSSGYITFTMLNVYESLKLAVKAASGAERLVLITYALAFSTLSTTVQTIAFPTTSTLPDASPLAYGWHASWNGHKASVVLLEHTQSDINNPSLWYDDRSRVVSWLCTLTLSRTSGVFGASLSVSSEATWQQNNGTTPWIWRPVVATGAVMCPFGAQGGGAAYVATSYPSNAPVYCYYLHDVTGGTDSHLAVVDISRSFTTESGKAYGYCEPNSWVFWDSGQLIFQNTYFVTGDEVTETFRVYDVDGAAVIAFVQSISQPGLSIQGIVYDGDGNGGWAAYPFDPDEDPVPVGDTSFTTYESVNCTVTNSQYWTAGLPVGGTFRDISLYECNPSGTHIGPTTINADHHAVLVIPINNAEAVGMFTTADRWWTNKTVTDFYYTHYPDPGPVNAAHKTDAVWYDHSKQTGPEATNVNPLGEKISLSGGFVQRIDTPYTDSKQLWSTAITYVGNNSNAVAQQTIQGTNTSHQGFIGSQYLSINTVNDPCRSEYPEIAQGVQDAILGEIAGEDVLLANDYPSELSGAGTVRQVGFA